MKKFFSILLIFFIYACATEKYGNISNDAPEIKVKDAFLDTTLLNKEVKVHGKIITQCATAGCWFFLKDDTGQILIDLKQLNLGLPQRTGKNATVSGIVIKEPSGQIIISAKGLLIK